MRISILDVLGMRWVMFGDSPDGRDMQAHELPELVISLPQQRHLALKEKQKQ